MTKNINKAIFLGSVLIWNDANICGGRMYLKVVVRDFSEWWNSLEMELEMMSPVPLMRCEYIDVSLLMRVYTSHWATMSWGSSLNGSKYAFFIHPRALGISVNNRIWNPCPSCCMFIYLYVAEANIYKRFSVRTSCHIGGMHQRFAIPLSLYPPIPYLQALEHIRRGKDYVVYLETFI